MDAAPTPTRWVGIDVSKASLEVAMGPAEQTFRVTNDAAGWQQLRDRLDRAMIQGVVLEATGAYHRGVTLALAGAGLAPAVINPQRSHAFLVSEGVRAKTDRSDARLLARFGQQKQPAPSPVASATAGQLAELVGCRDDLVKMATMEKNRLHGASAVTAPVHQTVLATLTAQIAHLDARISELIAADAPLAARDRLLRTVPGVGPVLSAVLLVRLAELGHGTAKPLAALAGVAPHARDSGIHRGVRRIGGGRPAVCKALYQMAQTATRANPVIRTHYRALRARRKPHKLAVIACARRMLGILHAMLRDGLT